MASARLMKERTISTLSGLEPRVCTASPSEACWSRERVKDAMAKKKKKKEKTKPAIAVERGKAGEVREDA